MGTRANVQNEQPSPHPRLISTTPIVLAPRIGGMGTAGSQPPGTTSGTGSPRSRLRKIAAASRSA